MSVIFGVLVYGGFALTPFGGFALLQLLLRSGWFTDGTEERKVPFFSTTAEYYLFKSRLHKWAVMIGFFIGWFITLGVYIYIIDTLGAYVYIVEIFYFGGT